MGQSPSRQTVSSRANNRSIHTIPSKHTRRYKHSDDEAEDTYDAPNLRRRSTSRRSEAQGVKFSRHLRTISGNTDPVSGCKQTTRPSTKTRSVRKNSTPDRHHYYDEVDSAHHRDVQTPSTLHPESRTHLSKSGSQGRQPRQKKECVICTDSRSLSRFPSEPPTAQCNHDADVCRRCLRTWINTTFALKIWDEISCPICSVRLAYEDVREFAPTEVFRRYRKLSKKAEKEAIPGWHWCRTKGCKSGQVVDATNKLCCMKCKKTYCIEHGTAWHKGETCTEYEYRTNKNIKKEEEKASKTLIKKISKSCPGCKRHIEKSYGCDHMTCSKCKHEFCWECLAPYLKKRDVNSVTHRENCVHYGDYHRRRAAQVVWDEFFVDR